METTRSSFDQFKAKFAMFISYQFSILIFSLFFLGCNKNTDIQSLKASTFVYLEEGDVKKLDDIDEHGILLYFVPKGCKRCFRECQVNMLSLDVVSGIQIKNRATVVLVIEDKDNMLEAECGRGSVYYSTGREVDRLFEFFNIDDKPQAIFIDEDNKPVLLGEEFPTSSFFESKS